MKIASPRLRLYERLYLWEVGRGMVVTARHLIGNLFHQGRMPTIQWPEEPKPLPVRIKGRHRLTQREDGSPKCVACYMCASACPSRCIHIVAEESPEPTIEKRPSQFDIDLLRCVFCGYCVEACPEDAIRMDTGEISIVSDNRDDFVFHIGFLLRGEGDTWKKSGVGSNREEPGKAKPSFPPKDEEETREGRPRGKKPPVPSSW